MQDEESAYSRYLRRWLGCRCCCSMEMGNSIYLDRAKADIFSSGKFVLRNKEMMLSEKILNGG